MKTEPQTPETIKFARSFPVKAQFDPAVQDFASAFKQNPQPVESQFCAFLTR